MSGPLMEQDTGITLTAALPVAVPFAQLPSEMAVTV
jgi:hypothetical protein